MARAVRRSVETKGGRAKPAARARRVTVAKEKSRPRTRTALSATRTAARTAGAVPVLAKAGARLGKVAKTVKAVKAAVKAVRAVKAAKPAAVPATDRRKAVRPATAPRRERKPLPPAEPPLDEQAVSGLTDEEQIESAKYQPRRAKPRVFEEERFLFPQSYGVNRLRLLVKDPEWLFAHWDVDPKSLEALRAELGNRASALSQLTLRIFEDKRGGASTFLLPQDARTWYVPMRTTGRAYRAEVGVILPTGEFRSLARSNSVATPRVGRSAQKAKRRVRYDRARPLAPGAAWSAAEDEAEAAESSWDTPLDAWASPEEEPRPSASSGDGRAGAGGASDVHRR
jgi:hypothetical protein